MCAYVRSTRCRDSRGTVYQSTKFRPGMYASTASLSGTKSSGSPPMYVLSPATSAWLSKPRWMLLKCMTSRAGSAFAKTGARARLDQSPVTFPGTAPYPDCGCVAIKRSTHRGDLYRFASDLATHSSPGPATNVCFLSFMAAFLHHLHIPRYASTCRNVRNALLAARNDRRARL